MERTTRAKLKTPVDHPADMVTDDIGVALRPRMNRMGHTQQDLNAAYDWRDQVDRNVESAYDTMVNIDLQGLPRPHRSPFMYVSGHYDQNGSLISYAPPEFSTDPKLLSEVYDVMIKKEAQGGPHMYTKDGHLQCVPDQNGVSKALAGEPPPCLAIRIGRRTVVDVSYGMLTATCMFHIERLYRMGYIVWITAFVNPAHHHEMMAKVLQTHRVLSIYLGFDPDKPVLTPRTDGLFLSCVHS